MSLLTIFALAVAALVGAPLLAHLLRRRNAEEHPFPAVRLLNASPPAARQRSMVEDRALFGVRALSILLLALLGATPFINCNHLSVSRKDGASVAMALVVDDSLSMRAPLAAGDDTTRFKRAQDAAIELVEGLREGDAVAVILAGSSPRIALAATTDLSSALETLAALTPSDRSTSLDEALHMGTDVLEGLPHRDKRVVLLSDLTDGTGLDTPLSTEGVTLWTPIPELAGTTKDCAVIHADRRGADVGVRIACDGATVEGRKLELRSGEAVIASQEALRAGDHFEQTLRIVEDKLDATSLSVVLTGTDDIAADDVAPVVETGGTDPIGIVADQTLSQVETGGPPPVEQALRALGYAEAARPLPAVPEHLEDLSSLAGIIIDDVPGLTPEARRALLEWLDRGGVLLLSLGPRAAAAPLGAGFDPIVGGVVRWSDVAVTGIDPASASTLGRAAQSLEVLNAKGRTQLEIVATDGADDLGHWSDGAPFLFRRSVGRGVVYTVTLPFSTAESDLALRPAFLALLDRFVSASRTRGSARRIEVGQRWRFGGYQSVEAQFRSEPSPIPLATELSGREPELVAPWIGTYDVILDGESVTRFTELSEQEIDFRIRPVEESAKAGDLGGVTPRIDASPYVALALLLLLAAELLLRMWSQRHSGRDPPVEDASVRSNPSVGDLTSDAKASRTSASA